MPGVWTKQELECWASTDLRTRPLSQPAGAQGWKDGRKDGRGLGKGAGGIEGLSTEGWGLLLHSCPRCFKHWG